MRVIGFFFTMKEKLIMSMLYIFAIRFKKDKFSGIDIIVIIGVIQNLISIFESNRHGIIIIDPTLARHEIKWNQNW